jgi:hypothetical protein
MMIATRYVATVWLILTVLVLLLAGCRHVPIRAHSDGKVFSCPGGTYTEVSFQVDGKVKVTCQSVREAIL